MNMIRSVLIEIMKKGVVSVLNWIRFETAN